MSSCQVQQAYAVQRVQKAQDALNAYALEHSANEDGGGLTERYKCLVDELTAAHSALASLPDCGE